MRRRPSSNYSRRTRGDVRPAQKQGDSHACPSCDQADFRIEDITTQDGLFCFVARCRVCDALLCYQKKL